MRVKRHRGSFTARALAACFGLALGVWAAARLWAFAANRMAYGSGALAEESLQIADFTLEGLTQTGDNTMVSTGDDAKMLLSAAERRVENVRLSITHSAAPLQVAVFWARPGEGHTVRRMESGAGGEEAFFLPSEGGQCLRIDPTSAAGDEMTVKSIVINQKRPLWRFLLPSAGQAAAMCAIACLCASGLSLLRRAGLWRRLRGACRALRKRGGGGI